MWQQECFVLLKSPSKNDQTKGINILYKNMSQSFKGFLFNQKFTKEQTEEVLQEAFIKIIKNFKAVKNETSFEAWCWQILRNSKNDYLREIKKNRSAMTVNEIENVEDSEMTKNIQQTVFDQSIDDCVALGIQKFNVADPDRGYAILLQMDGYAIKDIAMRIDRTPAATKEFLRQVRIKLAPFIKHCLDIIE